MTSQVKHQSDHLPRFFQYICRYPGDMHVIAFTLANISFLANVEAIQPVIVLAKKAFTALF